MYIYIRRSTNGFAALKLAVNDALLFPSLSVVDLKPEIVAIGDAVALPKIGWLLSLDQALPTFIVPAVGYSKYVLSS